MSIISLGFALFLLIAVIAYFITPSKYQWVTLLAASYIFYMFASVKLLFFLLLTTTSTYCVGLLFGKVNLAYERRLKEGKETLTRAQKRELKQEFNRKKKLWLLAALLLNFGVLFILKYTNILVGVLNLLRAVFRMEGKLDVPKLFLPLGISFYTFQSMGYLIDVYRNKYKPERNWEKFALFVSFFPQLIQGPISRYDQLAAQLYAPHSFDYQRVKHGLELMLWGYFKKMVISDRIAIMTGAIFATPGEYQGFYIAFGALFGLFELYTDFSGGIDIVRGVSEIFGIIMPENFKRPYFATSLADYWRRWHITLNDWWRDYIFYPMVLSETFTKLGKFCRKHMGDTFGKKIPIFIALFCARFINGIWHGVSVYYVIVGLYHGVLISLSFVFEEQIGDLGRKLRIKTDCASWRIFQSLRTFALLFLIKVQSKATSFSEIIIYYKSLFAKFNPWILFDESLFKFGVNRREFTVVILALAVLFVVSLLQEKGYHIREKLDEQNLVFRWGIYLCGILSVVLFGVYGPGYDAAKFLYQGF